MVGLRPWVISPQAETIACIGLDFVLSVNEPRKGGLVRRSEILYVHAKHVVQHRPTKGRR